MHVFGDFFMDVSDKAELEDIRLTSQKQAEAKAELSGTVLDGNSRPLQGARVTLDDLPGMLAPTPKTWY
jgi:protocatechuate 3,4-dioxygenase beta subunit